MKNFEKYIEYLGLIIKKNISIINVPIYLYGKVRNMNADELSAFLVDEYTVDLAPKRLTVGQCKELEYMLKRGATIIHFENGNWYAGDLALIEEYDKLDNTLNYDIAYLLDNDREGLLEAESIKFDSKKRNYIELDYYSNQDTNYEFKFKVDDLNQIYKKVLIGTRNADRQNSLLFQLLESGDLRTVVGTKGTLFTFNQSDMVGLPVIVKSVDKVLTIQLGNAEPLTLGEIGFNEFTSDLKLIFGALRTGEAISSYCDLELHYLKVWDSQKSISLKPIQVVRDNKVVTVLYDEVNKVEYELKENI